MSELDKEQVLIISGSEYTTTYNKKFINRKVWSEPNLNHIYSYIPGTIVDLLVSEGQPVEEGETILILEAMKMNNSIQMPFDGKIVKINVEKGQKIPKNFLMIEIEPAE
jgi:biotin carboxyl carrier protein